MSGSGELTEREREVLEFVAAGATNKEIASKLYISPNTVKVHLRNIFAKVGVSSRTEATLFAIQTGLVNLDEGGMSVSPSGRSALAVSATPARSLPAQSRWLVVAAAVLLLGAAAVIAFTLNRRSDTEGAISQPQPQGLDESRWIEQPAMRSERSGLAVAVRENQVYAIAGENERGVTGMTERFDPISETWSTLPSKPVPVADVGAAVVGGRILVPGGRLADGEITDILAIYDPQFETWGYGAPLPNPRSAYALVEHEGKLYLFGGWDGNAYRDTVFEYDPELDRWNGLSSMPGPRGYAGAVVAGDAIYVMGGHDGEKALTANSRYFPGRDGDGGNPWEEASPMPGARYAMGITIVADIVHLMGGNGGSNTAQLLKYFPNTNEWEEYASPIKQLWTDLGLVAVETYVYAMGGTYDGMPTAKLVAYQALYTINIPLVP